MSDEHQLKGRHAAAQLAGLARKVDAMCADSLRNGWHSYSLVSTETPL